MLFERAWIAIVLALCRLHTGKSQGQVLLPPENATGVDIGATIVAGADLTYNQYIDIAHQMQVTFKGRLWVYVQNGRTMHFQHPTNERLNANETFVGIGKLELLQAGLPTAAPYFAVGHSYGGTAAYDDVAAYPELANAVVLWASSIYDNAYDTYPVPVMTISGDLDGSLTLFGLQKNFRELNGRVEGGETVFKFRYPYHIITGINHAQYATGDLPDNIIRTYIEPEVSNYTARVLIANATLNFLQYLITNDENERSELEEILNNYYNQTAETFTPITQVLDIEEYENTSRWVDATQFIIAAVNDTDKLQTQNLVVSADILASMQPELSVDDNGIVITQTYTCIKRQLTDEYSSATVMETKVKSSQAINEAINNKTLPNNPATYCKDVNEAALNFIWNNLIPNLQKNRFLARNISIEFLPDIATSTGPEWLDSDLLFEYDFDGKKLLIQSTNLITDSTIGGPLGPYSGQHYCKQASPAKIQEFIYVHSLYDYYYS